MLQLVVENTDQQLNAYFKYKCDIRRRYFRLLVRRLEKEGFPVEKATKRAAAYKRKPKGMSEQGWKLYQAWNRAVFATNRGFKTFRSSKEFQVISRPLEMIDILRARMIKNQQASQRRDQERLKRTQRHADRL